MCFLWESICQKGDSQRSSSITHRYQSFNCLLRPRMHTYFLFVGEKPFSCNFCGKKFTQWNQLNTHLRRHTGPVQSLFFKNLLRKFIPNFDVDILTFTFSGERPFKCSLCGAAFNTQTILKNHCLTHTGRLFINSYLFYNFSK